MTSENPVYNNPYLAAITLSDSEEQLLALHQFLEEELERVNKRLERLENEDGSIPDGVGEEWSMVKGKLDQTRLLYGMITQCIIASNVRGDDE